MQVVYYGMIVIITQPLGSFAPLAVQPSANANGKMFLGLLNFYVKTDLSDTKTPGQ